MWFSTVLIPVLITGSISVKWNVFKCSHNCVNKLHDLVYTLNVLNPPCSTHIYQNKVVGSRHRYSNLANSAWKFPEGLAFCGSSSCGPLRAMLFFLQKIIVLKRDSSISQFLLICCWSKLLICWPIGTNSLVIFLKKFSIVITAKLYISHFLLTCLVKP